MVPKVTPYDVDQAVCEINVPNNIQPSNIVKLSKIVRQEDAVAVVLESV